MLPTPSPKHSRHYTLKGNFRRAATHKQNLAELYEVEMGDGKRAAEAYETAAGWYENDNAEALANKLFLKLADLSALESDYYKAISNYEKVAKSSINNNLMKWSVKEYLLKAGICHLCTGDSVATNRALESYRDLDPSFSQTREHQLLSDLVEAVDEGDQEKFADKLFQYDQMSKLDKWKTTLLLRVKENIEEKGEDFSSRAHLAQVLYCLFRISTRSATEMPRKAHLDHEQYVVRSGAGPCMAGPAAMAASSVQFSQGRDGIDSLEDSHKFTHLLDIFCNIRCCSYLGL
ncbi:hypothetical protein KC360_g230 [Hortaea werneckii]|nr:hypothetical protein KC344_g232 [Hortaea werneckii]KAI7180407.1 hypothetical protein KC360_g230 [Hortaea werneckii]